MNLFWNPTNENKSKSFRVVDKYIFLVYFHEKDNRPGAHTALDLLHKALAAV